MNSRGGRKPKLNAPTPAFARTAVELSEHVTNLGTEKVAEVLRVEVADLEPLLAGRVMPTEAGMRALRKLS
jgi:hypothetical protein